MDERIEGARVVLRRWRLSDVDALEEIVSSSLDHIAKFMSSAASEVADPAAFVALVDDAWNAGTVFAYAIEQASRIVGHITFSVAEPGGEIGYWVRVEDLGRGIATDALRTLTTHVFQTSTAVKSITSSCNAANVASTRVLENAGFRLESRKPWQPRNSCEADEELAFVLERA